MLAERAPKINHIFRSRAVPGDLLLFRCNGSMMRAVAVTPTTPLSGSVARLREGDRSKERSD